MGILDIVHGIFPRLLLCHIKIKIQVAVGTAREKDIPRRVASHVLNNIPDRDEISGALGHGNRLTVPHERHQLHEQDMESATGMSECLDHCLHARDVPVVIGAPDVHERLESARQFLPMIGDISGEVRVTAVLFDHYPVFIVPEGSGTQPAGPVLFVHVFPRREFLDRLLDSSPGKQRCFTEPGIELHAESIEVGTDIGKHGLASMIGEQNLALLKGRVQVLFPLLVY